MERSILFRRQLLAVLVLFAVALLFAGCRYNILQPATLEVIDYAEAAWLAAPTASYRITVEIERPGERRRSTVTVEDHRIIEGVVSYWDFEARQWQESYALNEEQSFPFTVPGLFDMIRGELEMSGREDVRMLMVGEPPFPHKINFGPIIVDGEPFPATKAVVTIQQFAPQ